MIYLTRLGMIDKPLYDNPAYVKALADAFNKWQQEVKENPEAFDDVRDSEGDYGVACAKKLIQLMKGE